MKDTEKRISYTSLDFFLTPYIAVQMEATRQGESSHPKRKTAAEEHSEKWAIFIDAWFETHLASSEDKDKFNFQKLYSIVTGDNAANSPHQVKQSSTHEFCFLALLLFPQ